MKLVSNWKPVLAQAWSVRLAMVAAIATTVQLLLPELEPVLPKEWFTWISLLAAIGVVIGRLIDQPELHE